MRDTLVDHAGDRTNTGLSRDGKISPKDLQAQRIHRVMTNHRMDIGNIVAVVVACASLSCSASSDGDGGFGGGGSAGAAGGMSAGAGGVSGGAGVAAGGTGGATGEDTLPSPGPAPAAAVGALIISKLATSGDGMTFGASAVFTNPAINLGTSAAQSMLSGYASVPLDTCKDINAGPQTVSSEQQNLLDVGELGIAAPNGQYYPVARQQFASYVFYEGDLPIEAFDPMAEYVVVGAGWQGPFWSPGDLVISQPAVGSGTVGVPRSAPFPVRWSGQPDGNPVMIFLIQGDTVITCRVSDDGQFDVPTSALTSFEVSGGAFDPTPDEADEIVIERFTWYPVATQNGIAAALVQFEVGARIEVAFD